MLEDGNAKISHRPLESRIWSSQQPELTIDQTLPSYAGNAPNVNNVCFCFPFPFFPFPPEGAASPASTPASSCSPPPPVLPPAPAPPAHGFTGGVAASPRIFRKLWFPLACGRALGPLPPLGSCGNAALLSVGCAFFLAPPATAPATPGPATENGTARAAGADDAAAAADEAPDADHGVLCGPCARGWTTAGVAGCSGGKRSGRRAGCAMEGGGGAEPGTMRAVDDPAACATRSQTCRDAWTRVAVEDFALSTRPLVIFAKPEPTADGMRSGNCRRCYP